jgi:hypothetical protein
LGGCPAFVVCWLVLCECGLPFFSLLSKNIVSECVCVCVCRLHACYSLLCVCVCV